MAIYAKLAGMGAALAVGLGGGVLLSVMNPLIPNQDQTRIAPAPQATQQVSATAESLPKLPAQASAPMISPSDPAKQPRSDSEDTTPLVTPQKPEPVITGQASELGAPSLAQEALPQMATGPDTGDTMRQTGGLTPPQEADAGAKVLAHARLRTADVGEVAELSIPDSSRQGQAPELPEMARVAPRMPENVTRQMPVGPRPVGDELAPEVSTEPAKPVVLAQPHVDTDIGGAVPQTPTPEGDRKIALAQPDTVVNQPVMGAKPAPPMGEASLANPENPARYFHKKKPIIKTGPSRLVLNGTAGFGGKGFSNNGIAGLKAKTQNPDTGGLDHSIGALDKYAVAFENTGKPLFSIVIMDGRPGGMPPRSLVKMPFPVTVAIPADLPDAAERAQIYRDAGFEVLALSPRKVSMSLSGGLDQSGVDKAVTRIFTALPEAVGLLDRPTGDLQRDRQLVKELLNRFKTTGHGLVTYQRGLNPVPRQAQRAGVYAGQVYKVLDGEKQGKAVIKRFLERAGQLARRDGHIIVMATSEPDTIATLVNWALGNKARGLALAPVSAVLRAGG